MKSVSVTKSRYNNQLNKKGFLQIYKPYIEYEDKTLKKKHKIYRFNNGWGVSIAQGEDCYGCTKSGHWSLAVIYWLSDEFWDFDLDVENPVCNGDVLWDVPDEEIDAILSIVERFPDYEKDAFKDR